VPELDREGVVREQLPAALEVALRFLADGEPGRELEQDGPELARRREGGQSRGKCAPDPLLRRLSCKIGGSLARVVLCPVIKLKALTLKTNPSGVRSAHRAALRSDGRE
jgi:hypothetical protein